MPGLDLSRYQYAALIFDCDGTLVDSASLHFRALRDALRAQGLELGQEWYEQRLGLSRRALFQQFEQCFGAKIDVASASELSDRIYASISHELAEIPLIASIAREHHGKVPMAVASGGERFVLATSLRAAGLVDLFDHVVSISDVGQGKPSPALFLEAARRLGHLPAECLVFDDTDEGIEAARRAGMPCIDVRKYTGTPIVTKDPGADGAVDPSGKGVTGN